MNYWIRRIGREPAADEIEPLTRALWEGGQRVSAADWLMAIEETQRFSRRVARFFDDVDLFLTPTMSAPPLPIGVMLSTADDPWRSMEMSAPTVRYAGVVANITGSPAMSVPLHWSDDGMPIGAHFLAPCGDKATLLRLAALWGGAQPWARLLPPVHATRIPVARA